MRASLAGMSIRQLRWGLAAFFAALAIPTAILVQQAYSQLKWEAFHQQQALAVELARRLEQRFADLIRAEEARGWSDYAFLVVKGTSGSRFVQPSPLAALPDTLPIPGLIGHFQVDAQGRFSSPLVPAAGTDPSRYGISPSDLAGRQALARRLQAVLNENRLVRAPVDESEKREPLRAQRPAETAAGGSLTAPALRADAAPPAKDDRAAAAFAEGDEQIAGQANFDQLRSRSESAGPKNRAPDSLGRVEDLKLEQRFQAEQAPAAVPKAQSESKAKEVDQLAQTGKLNKRLVRREQAVLAEPVRRDAARRQAPAGRGARAPAEFRIRTFDREVDGFEFSRLESGPFVLYRNVWQDGQRQVQGLLLDPQAWLRGVVQPVYREAAVSHSSDLVVAYRGDVLALFGAQAAGGKRSYGIELQGELLYRSRLPAPLADLEWIFSAGQLPAGPGASVLGWLAAILAVVLAGGFVLMERLGAGQIRLARQQQDFVSAVSHELKTPLTSIRMYGEMLREGWAPEDKKRSYYEFIHDEAERLSRLINNVLQLARLTRNELQVNANRIAVRALVDAIRSRVGTQVAQAGFELTLNCDDETGRTVVGIDEDFFAQIIINLVDNAIKFSSRAERKQVDIACRRQQDGTVLVTVRDYGPGLPATRMKEVFRLFYRLENELTRETVGTGIGLALVRQLAHAMNCRVDVVNRSPGAEFRLAIPV